MSSSVSGSSIVSSGLEELTSNRVSDGSTEEIDFMRKNGGLEEFLFPVLYTLKRHKMFLDKAEAVRFTVAMLLLDFLQMLPVTLWLTSAHWGTHTHQVLSVIIAYLDINTYLMNEPRSTNLTAYALMLGFLLAIFICSRVIHKATTFSRRLNPKV